MVKLRKCFNLIFLFAALPAWADEAGQFDYYILALSWNAGWCEIEGERKNAPQCTENKRSGFALHGLWPQYQEGWPEYCTTTHPNPSRAETNRQAELYGSSGSAWHQWDKHGRCTGQNYQSYYENSKMLTERYTAPDIFLDIQEIYALPADVIEEAMHETYPELTDENMAVICRDGIFQEIRICLDKDFEPTDCLGSAARDCAYDADFIPSF